MKPYLPTFLLLALCAALPPAFLVAPLSLSSVGCSAYSRAILPLLLFHFTHANPFHLLANTIALLLIKPRFSTLPLSFIAATLAAALLYIVPSLTCGLYPHIIPSLPTCGLSAIICAIIARSYVAWRKPVLPFILLQLPFLLLPNFNFLLHITSFLISYLLWKITYLLKAGRRTSSSPRTSDDATASSSKA